MPPRDSTTTSTRRHPSLALRPRARTAVHTIPLPKDFTFDQWKETSPEEVYDHNASAVEEIEPFAQAVPRRRAAKSFSSLRHPMDGLVALGRRLSVTLRNKSSKHNMRVQGEEENDDDCHYQVSGHYTHKRNAASGNWDVRPQTWSKAYSVNRRPSLNSVEALHGFYAPTAAVPAPIPGHGLAPPILPNDKFSGAAARAAAAAQNEQMELARQLARAERDKALEPIVTQDSESGIGIDLRDPSDINTQLGLLRIGKSSYLRTQFLPCYKYG